jgi:hypothetical protein
VLVDLEEIAIVLQQRYAILNDNRRNQAIDGIPNGGALHS